MSTLSPLDLLAAHPWERAVFTTYALSLSFFEAVVLDALVRGGTRERLILADIEGVRGSLSEQGACRVGKDYDLEPFAVGTGVFHPKISVLTADNECHLLVGSGNLSFGGWGGNLEVLEHLHPTFAADAVLDAADFFDRLAQAAHVRHGAADRCLLVAEQLRRAAQGHPRDGSIRLFHSLDGAIADKLVAAANDLGGAQRIVVASPFWDTGAAIDDLCERLGLDHAYVHAHAGGTVRGNAGSNWPASPAIDVRPVRLAAMDEDKPRQLHAKAIEVLCKRGRLLVSGSANATTAALRPGRNVEACVVRIQRERSTGWIFSASEPPEFIEELETADETESGLNGVLRAVLEGDVISGRVLSPLMSGDASVFHLTPRGPEPLGQTRLGDRGTFRVAAPGLEIQSWTRDRLVLRVEANDGRAAEGYVSVSAYAALGRRLGLLGPKLFAVISGTETPADIAAIMSWFHEHPYALTGQLPGARGHQGAKANSDPDLTALIPVNELGSGTVVSTSAMGQHHEDSRHWSRFMQHVFAAFRQSRGPLGATAAGRKGDDDDDDDAAVRTSTTDRAVEKSLASFERLLDLLLSQQNAAQYALTALDLTQYISERLEPPSTKVAEWLQRLIGALMACNVPLARQPDVAAVILMQFGTKPDKGVERSARARLLRLGYDLSGPPPSLDHCSGFQSVLPQAENFGTLWARVQAIRTFHEQAGAYLQALKAGKPTAEYQELLAHNPEEKATLEAAFRSADPWAEILVMGRWTETCPRHYISLPTGERSKLRSYAVAKAKNCCSRVVIWPGE